MPKLLVLTLALLVGACIGLWCVRRYQPRRPGSGLAKHAPAHIPVMLRLPRPGIRARWRGGLLVIDGDETRWRRRWQIRRRREITLGTLTRVERRGVLGSERWWLKADAVVYRCESSVGDLQLAVPAAHQPTFERLVGGWSGVA